MKRHYWLVLLVLAATMPASGQYKDETLQGSVVKPDEAAKPDSRYANMPDEAVPYRRFAKPYYDWFTREDTLQYHGAADQNPSGDPSQLQEISIGFMGPIENNPEAVFGLPELHGAQLAIEQANARGGYYGKPFALKIHNESALWGASSTELVKMRFDENCWAMLGCVDGQNCHISLRVALKLEVPIVDVGTTDPTVTETRIPWLLHNFPDDRQQGYTLADYVFKTLKLKRIGVIRTQTRYARLGVGKFGDEARRIGHQPVLEVKFERGDKDFTHQLQMLRDAKVEGIVIWGEAAEAGLILKQMREMGMKQPVFGSSRLAYAQLLAVAGPAAEGLVVTSPLDPTRDDPQWLPFQDAYRQKFHEDPIDYAAYSYDGMNLLLAAIEKAGLNRGRIMDALRDYQMKTYQGVTGTTYFDHTLNNLAPVNLARVKDGKFEYCLAPRQHGHEGAASSLSTPPTATPYARIDRAAVNYSGPGRDASHDLATSEIRIGLLTPLTGPRQVEGEALRRAAGMAIEEENTNDPPGSRPLALVARDEGGPWGKASSEIVHMVFDDEVVAIVTSADGGTAHLAEQIANKTGVPVLTMSTDTTTTEINLPWIFRLGQTDADQAEALVHEIYGKRKFERIALLTQDDHDGREGGDEFENAARKLHAPPPVRLMVPLEGLPARRMEAALARTQAVVIWTDAPGAIRLVGQVRQVLPALPIYLCRKAAPGDWTRSMCNDFQVDCGNDAALGTFVAPAQPADAASAFEQNYLQRFGVKPGLGAAQAYDAVCVLAVALRQSGPNRTRLRDSLARLSGFKGESGVISFDRAGNNLSTFTPAPTR